MAVARKGEAPLIPIAKDFVISEGCLHNWMKKADVADGALAVVVDLSGGATLHRREPELREVPLGSAGFLSM